ncbi:MAG: lipopolysaccharide biosynthesis protein [Spirochaetales bacterium]|nr:lipopolysaccharide biosynthesis protein [Spirochaetales bacterium]
MAVSKKQFAANAVWKILEQFSAKGITMLVSIVLLRLVPPADHGLIALTAIFTNLSDILIDGGFSTALIRKETVDDYDYNAVFSISFLISSVLYAVLFFASPFASDYYQTPQLTPVLRVMGILFFIQSFNAVRNGIVNRNMQFKLLFVSNSISSIISGVLGIVAAYAGLGVWAIVIQRLSQQAIMTIILVFKVNWHIRWRFDFARIKQMLSFSLGVVGSSLLNYVGGSIYSIVIGKRYSVTDLGYYDKGAQLPMQFSLYTFGSMSNVLLPTLSSCQTDLERVKTVIRKVVAMTSFLIIPMMTGMAFVSRELVIILFTDVWLPAVPVMQYSCLYYLATPFMLINIQVFFALGKSRLRVKTEIIRLILIFMGLGIFGFALKCSMNELALVSAFIACIVSFVTYVEVRRMIDYNLGEVLADMWKPAIGSAAMAAVLFFLNRLIQADSLILILIIKVFAGVVVYLAFALLLRMPELRDVLGIMKVFKKKEEEST